MYSSWLVKKYIYFEVKRIENYEREILTVNVILFEQSYKVEEHEKIIQDQPGEIRQEKTVVVSQDEEGIKQRDVKAAQIPKPTRKSTAPRFVSPLTGMIVDQGTDIILEGIIDGEKNKDHILLTCDNSYMKEYIVKNLCKS